MSNQGTDIELYSPDSAHMQVALSDGATVYSSDATGKFAHVDAAHVDELRAHGLLTERPSKDAATGTTTDTTAAGKKA